MLKQDVLDHFGTQQKVAKAIGRTQPWVSTASDPLPFDVQVQVAVITDAALMPDEHTMGQLRSYVDAYYRIVNAERARKRAPVRKASGGR